MISICKIFKFEAAHFLPNHKGKCRNMHGHSYKLEVEITGPIQSDNDSPAIGMIMDFGSLKNIVELYISDKDHSTLNETVCPNPTAENMVLILANRIGEDMLLTGCSAKLSRLRLWETDTSWAEWRSNK